MKPLKDRIIAEIMPLEVKTKGGLILSGEAVDQSNGQVRYAKVVAIGVDVKTAKPGDIVAHDRIVGSPFKKDGKDYIVFKEEHILFIEETE